MSTPKQNSSLFKKFAEKFLFADEAALISTLKATAFKVKEGEVTDAQMMALLIVADQYGLNPFTKEIFAYPDKNGIVPVVSVDGWSRIINEHHDLDGIEFVYDNQWVRDKPDAKDCPLSIECVIYRKSRNHPIRIREFLDECFREPFKGSKNNQPYVVNGPWQSHTKRLLRHKSLIQCARIAFGFVGIYDQDEAERIIAGEASVIDDRFTGNASADHLVPQEPSDEAKRRLTKLVDRCLKDGTWQAAIEWVSQTYSGFDVTFLKDGLTKAKAEAATALPLNSTGNASAKNEQQLALTPPPSTNDASKKSASAGPGNQSRTVGNGNGNATGNTQSNRNSASTRIGGGNASQKPHQAHLDEARAALA